MMMTNEPRIWEIWQFAFTYEDKPEKSKLRPVIIAAKNNSEVEVLVLSVKVTSHPPRVNFAGEIPILDWEEAGLSKPSTARCSKHLLVPISAFHGAFRYGRLSKRDEIAVHEAMQAMGLID